MASIPEELKDVMIFNPGNGLSTHILCPHTAHFSFKPSSLPDDAKRGSFTGEALPLGPNLALYVETFLSHLFLYIARCHSN